VNFDRRLIKLLRNCSGFFSLSLVCALVSTVFLIAIAYYLALFVDAIFIKGLPAPELHSCVTMFAVCVACRIFFWMLGQLLRSRVAFSVKSTLSGELTDHLSRIGPIEVRHINSGTITATYSKGIDALEHYFSEYLPQVFLSIILPLFMVIYIYRFSFTAGIILTFTVPLIPVFMIFIGTMAKSKSENQWLKLKVLSSRFLDMLQGIVTLKLLGRSKSQVESLRNACDEFRDSTMSVLKVAFLSALVLEVVSTLSVAVLAVTIGIKLIYAEIEFFDAFFILIIAPDVYLPMRNLGAKFHTGMEGLVAAKSIYSILEIEPTPANNPTNEDAQAEYAVSFTDVELIYPKTQRRALDHITFSVANGENIAIVGATGAGKSSIFNLLLGFVEPTRGGVDADRDKISWLSQRPYMFNTTILENIRVGYPHAVIDKVHDAARSASIHDFVMSLPDGYDTVVGENGMRLSGGQAKRVALARALIKDASILLIDESTSDLDPVTEADIVKMIYSLRGKKTVLTIAHRLQTVKDADRLFVLDHGRIIEEGTYLELLERDGTFANLLRSGGFHE